MGVGIDLLVNDLSQKAKISYSDASKFVSVLEENGAANYHTLVANVTKTVEAFLDKFEVKRSELVCDRIIKYAESTPDYQIKADFGKKTAKFIRILAGKR